MATVPNFAANAGGEPDALHDVAALLAEQLSACHAAAARCFAIANDEEDFQLPARLEALKEQLNRVAEEQRSRAVGQDSNGSGQAGEAA